METNFIKKINSVLNNFMYSSNEEESVNTIDLFTFLTMDVIPMKEKVDIVVLLISNFSRINTVLDIALVDTFSNIRVELYNKNKYKLFRFSKNLKYNHTVRMKQPDFCYDFLENNNNKILGGGDNDRRINLFDTVLFLSQLYSKVLNQKERHTREWRPFFILFENIVLTILMKYKPADKIRIPAEFYLQKRMKDTHNEFYNYLCKESKLLKIIHNVINKEKQIYYENKEDFNNYLS